MSVSRRGSLTSVLRTEQMPTLTVICSVPSPHGKGRLRICVRHFRARFVASSSSAGIVTAKFVPSMWPSFSSSPRMAFRYSASPLMTWSPAVRPYFWLMSPRVSAAIRRKEIGLSSDRARRISLGTIARRKDMRLGRPVRSSVLAMRAHLRFSSRRRSASRRSRAFSCSRASIRSCICAGVRASGMAQPFSGRGSRLRACLNTS